MSLLILCLCAAITISSACVNVGSIHDRHAAFFFTHTRLRFMFRAETSDSKIERSISTPAQHASGSSDCSRLHSPIPRSLVTALSGHHPPRVTFGMSDDFQCSHIFLGHNRAFLQQQDRVIWASNSRASCQRYHQLGQGSC